MDNNIKMFVELTEIIERVFMHLAVVTAHWLAVLKSSKLNI